MLFYKEKQMNKNKLAIFGFPRSATKLLASIYEQQGYHNFGEFFSATTYLNNNSVPNAIRLSRPEQMQMKQKESELTRWSSNFEQFKFLSNRISSFKNYKNIPEKSIVTFWMHNVSVSPELLSQFDDRYVLLPRRSNKFEQLLSRMLVLSHFNQDGEVPSSPITINLKTSDKFEFAVYQMSRTYALQDHFISQGRGCVIDFDELITGRADLGFEYTVTSDDQHTDFSSLVTNLSEVREAFEKLEKIYF